MAPWRTRVGDQRETLPQPADRVDIAKLIKQGGVG